MTEFNDKLNELIDTSLVADQAIKSKRSYLGASRLGVSCSRLLQYEYQNVPKDDGREFNGKTLRTFAAGHLFEELAIKWFKKSGFTLLIRDDNGKQFGFVAANGKVAGHVDGVIVGAPDSLKLQVPAVWEMKSMNSKNWKATCKKSLRVQNPVYASQIALYQAYMEEQFPSISKHPALFTAINKDTSELYHELIPFDAELAQRMSDKAVNILKACDAGEILPRIAANPDFYECKYCPYQDRCWEVGHD